MKTQEELEKLTKKYFFEQKFIEVAGIFIGIVAIVFIPYLLGVLGGVQENLFSAWLFGILMIFSVMFVGMGLIWLFNRIYVIYRKWIKYNWKTARKRAKKELKEK